MVRDLAEESVRLVKKTEADRHKKDAEEAALKKIQEAMWPSKKTETRSPMDIIFGEKKAEPAIDQGEKERRKDLLERIRSGELDDRMIEIEVEDKSGTSGDSDNEQANQISMMLSNMMPKKTRKKRVTVRQAKSILQRKPQKKWSIWKSSRKRQSAWLKNEVSSLLMKLIRLPEETIRAGQMSQEKACRGISFPS